MINRLPPGYLRIHCDICKQNIAVADSNDLKTPITGGMFQPFMLGHGIAPPFHESLTWETMRCPICHTRPFIDPNFVMVSAWIDGHTRMIPHEIGSDDIPIDPEGKTGAEINQEIIDNWAGDDEELEESGITAKASPGPQTLLRQSHPISQEKKQPVFPWVNPTEGKKTGAIKCSKCGQEFKHRSSKTRHEKQCKKG